MKQFLLIAIAAATLSAQAGPEPKLRARELFYKDAAQKTSGPKAAAAPVLGVKYRLMRSSAASEFAEASAATTFRNGDKLRIVVEANADSYLYIAAKGTSGAWEVLFPNAKTAGGDNRVQKMKAATINFSVQGEPGEEKVFLILSRQPETNLDGIIYKVSGGTGAAPPPRLIASRINAIDDAMIGRVRNAVRSRDLVFESVDDDRKEKAAYVVNASAAPDARLYADIAIKHR